MEINEPFAYNDQPVHNRVVFFILILILFFLSFVRISHTDVPIVADKLFLITIASSTAFLVWLLGTLFTRSVSFPRSAILYGATFVYLSQLLATVTSASRGASFWGSMFDSDNLIFSTIILLLIFLSSVVFQSLSRIAMAYLALFAGLFVLFVSQLINLFVGKNYNLLGTWYDLGVIFGLALLVSLVFIELSPKRAFYRKLGWIVFGFSSISLVFINFSLVWLIVGFGALFIALYSYWLGPGGRGRAVVSVLVVGVSVACLVFGRPNAPISRLVNKIIPTPTEIRPSWAGTYALTVSSLKKNPIFGAGPGLFSREWVKYKDVSINKTDYWSIDFSAGVGYLPSKVLTSGILGTLALLTFLILIFKQGIFLLKKLSEPTFEDAQVLATIVATFYLWIVAIFYVPNPTTLAFSAIFTGLLIATFASKELTDNLLISSSVHHKLKIVITILSVLFFLGTSAVMYEYGRNYVALWTFRDSVVYAQNGDINKAIDYAKRTLSLDTRDIYHRHASDVYLLALAKEVSSIDPNSPRARETFIKLFGDAVAEAKSAVEDDETNYLNYLALGSVYESVVTLGIEGAYEQARLAYKTAGTLNPTSPTIPFQLARLELANKNIQNAVQYLNESISLKSNYAPAYILASQIALGGGDLPTAIKTTELAVLSDPNNFTYFFQLGYLRYKNKDYRLALESFNRTLALNKDYANARYFLGLTYAKIGKITEAIFELESVLKSNPGNKEVQMILEKVKVGSTSFDI